MIGEVRRTRLRSAATTRGLTILCASAALLAGAQTAAAASCRPRALQVVRGQVLLDGQRVHPGADRVRMLGRPIWRADRCAVAWIERRGPVTRLVVIPQIEGPPSALPWHLPAVSRADRVFWAARTRVVVGRHLLAPRAVATWTETLETAPSGRVASIRGGR
jgi:hypothetical protein